MKKNFYFYLFFLIFLLSLLYLLFNNFYKRKNNYNIILISIDLLNSKHLNFYGYPLKTTPFLDEFFSQSYTFSNAIAPSSWTPPSTMSLFTSLYPHEHKIIHLFRNVDIVNNTKVFANLKKLNPSVVTLAEILKKNGYATGSFSGNAGIRPELGFNQGFDFYQINPNGRTSKYSHHIFDFSMPESLKWLEKNKNKNFFLFLQGFDLHGKNIPPQNYDYRYVKQPYLGTFTGSRNEYEILGEAGLYNEKLFLSQEDEAFWNAIYDEKINNVDSKIQDFITKIETMGLLQNTVLIITSSHGQEYYGHGQVNYGHSLYQELIHVPLAIRLPEQTEGKRIESLVSTMDIMPTILSILKIKNPVPNQIKGIDLTPSFYGEDVSRNVYAETDKFPNLILRSIQTPDGWKLILSLNSSAKELYNLKSDPGELMNLIEEEQKISYELEQKLKKNLLKQE